MATAHSSQLALPPPPNMERLPSIRELHFAYRSPPSQGTNPPPPGQDHPPHAAPPPSRHDSAGWSRQPPSSNPPSSQHSPSMPPPSEHAKHPQATHKPDGAYAQPAHPYASHPPPAPTSHRKARADAPRASSKRGRSDSTVSASSGRSPHTAYPPNYPQVQPSPTSYHPVPSGPSPQPPPETVQQPSHFSPSGPGYAYHPPPQQHMAPRQQYTQQAPPPQSQQPPARTPNPYHPPPPPAHEQWQHQQPPPSQQQAPPPPPSSAHHHQSQAPSQGQQYEFTRTTPIVPAPAEPRNMQMSPSGQRENMVQEIVRHCTTLWSFASKYGQAAQAQNQPDPEELRNMSYSAALVVRLLDDLRRMSIPPEQRQNLPSNPVPEEPRVPKRPWEDVAREDDPPTGSTNPPELSEENSQDLAHQDMEIIRSKRATSSGTSNSGQPKSKYRKRSQRATPPGKCHSCNIRETPEWRRGPDGARTLCNACGLHYAKLMRKRDKTLGADGKPMPIDLQTLRASTASSRGGGAGEHGGESSQQAAAAPPPPSQHPSIAASPYEHKHVLQGPESPQHPSPTHAVSYHLMPPPSAGAPPPHPSMHPPSRGGHEHHPTSAYVPLPPWQAHGGGGTPEQTYMRPSHGRASPH